MYNRITDNKICVTKYEYIKAVALAGIKPELYCTKKQALFTKPPENNLK